MSTDTKPQPGCDCLNHCGDDPWLAKGKSAPCDKLQQQREREMQRALEFVRVNSLMQLYGVTTTYDLIEHLHEKVTTTEAIAKIQSLNNLSAWLDGLGSSIHTYSLRGIALAAWEARDKAPPAALQQAEPEGYKLVPVKPTPEILEAICHAKNLTRHGLRAVMWDSELASIYTAMLAAAPTTLEASHG